jgi:hypothetical protein
MPEIRLPIDGPANWRGVKLLRRDVVGRSALSGPVEQAHAQGRSGGSQRSCLRVRLPGGRPGRRLRGAPRLVVAGHSGRRSQPRGGHRGDAARPAAPTWPWPSALTGPTASLPSVDQDGGPLVAPTSAPPTSAPRAAPPQASPSIAPWPSSWRPTSPPSIRTPNDGPTRQPPSTPIGGGRPARRPRLPPHLLTWLEDAGIPARVIDELMGHQPSGRAGRHLAGQVVTVRLHPSVLQVFFAGQLIRTNSTGSRSWTWSTTHPSPQRRPRWYEEANASTVGGWTHRDRKVSPRRSG